MTSTNDDIVNFVKLFRPLNGQQTVEFFRLSRADLLQDMGEPLPGIIPKRLARTEKGIHYGGASAYKDFLIFLSSQNAKNSLQHKFTVNATTLEAMGRCDRHLGWNDCCCYKRWC